MIAGLGSLLYRWASMFAKIVVLSTLFVQIKVTTSDTVRVRPAKCSTLQLHACS
jgi:hypothetical protein